MAKDIAVVGYNTAGNAGLTLDAFAIQKILITGGYDAQVVHQWVFNEPNPAFFKQEEDWDRFDGVVICGFYQHWNLRELIKAGRPVICANVGYADDLGLGEREQQHLSEDDYLVTNGTHPITAGLVGVGPIDVGNSLWADAISVHNHHVDVLATTLANHVVLAAHKTHPLVYWGWYRMSQATPNGILDNVLRSAANWAFGGP